MNAAPCGDDDSGKATELLAVVSLRHPVKGACFITHRMPCLLANVGAALRRLRTIFSLQRPDLAHLVICMSNTAVGAGVLTYEAEAKDDDDNDPPPQKKKVSGKIKALFFLTSESESFYR